MCKNFNYYWQRCEHHAPERIERCAHRQQALRLDHIDPANRAELDRLGAECRSRMEHHSEEFDNVCADCKMADTTRQITTEVNRVLHYKGFSKDDRAWTEVLPYVIKKIFTKNGVPSVQFKIIAITLVYFIAHFTGQPTYSIRELAGSHFSENTPRVQLFYGWLYNNQRDLLPSEWVEQGLGSFENIPSLE